MSLLFKTIQITKLIHEFELRKCATDDVKYENVLDLPVSNCPTAQQQN